MKQLIAATVLVGISNMALAADAPQLRHRFTEFAPVVDVEPVFRQVRHDTPHKECWVEQEEQVVIREGSNNSFNSNRSRSSRSHSGGDALVGGVIGGVIGNQLGKRSGRGARNGATVAGAIIGSVIANEVRGSDVSRHRRHRNNDRIENTTTQRVVTTRPVEHCRESVKTSYEQRVQAYDVTYQYRGQTFTTRMKRDPGDRIELQVNIAPARH